MTTPKAVLPRQSRFAMVAIILLLLAHLGIVMSFLFEKESRGSFFGPEFENFFQVLYLGVLWIISSVLTLVAIVRASIRRCSWHLVIAAAMLCLLFPMAAWVRLNPPVTRFLVASAGRGDEARVRWCLAMGVDINRPWLVTIGMDYTQPKTPGETPLTMAVKSRQFQMVRLLVQKGADVNRPDGQDRTPLERAIQIPDATMVQLLLDLGAKVDPTNRPRALTIIQQTLDSYAYYAPSFESQRVMMLQVRERLEKATSSAATEP